MKATVSLLSWYLLNSRHSRSVVVVVVVVVVAVVVVVVVVAFVVEQRVTW